MMMSVILPNIDAANPWLVLLFSYALLLSVAFMQAANKGVVFLCLIFFLLFVSHTKNIIS